MYFSNNFCVKSNHLLVRLLIISVILLMLVQALFILEVHAHQEIEHENLITLDFKDTDIREVLRAINLQTGVNIVAEPDVTGNVTIRLVDVPLEEGLRHFLSSYDWILEIKDGVYRVKQGVNRSPLRVNVFQNRISILAEEAPLDQVILAAAGANGISILPLTSLTGTVTARFESVSFEEVLDNVLKGRDLIWRKEGEVYYIDQASVQALAQENKPLPVERVSPSGIAILNIEDGLLTALVRDVLLEDFIAEILLKYPEEEIPAIAASGNVAKAKLSGLVSGVPIKEGLERLLLPSALKMEAVHAGYQIEEIPEPKPYQVSYKDGMLSIRSEQALLKDILHEIAVITNVTFLLPEHLPSYVSVDIHDLSPALAMEILLHSSGGYTIQSYPDVARGLNPWTGIFQINAPEVWTVKVSEEDSLFSLEAKGAELVHVLNKLGEAANCNIILQQGNYPLVTLKLNDLSLEEILSIIVQPHGGEIVNHGSYFYVQMSSPSFSLPPQNQVLANGINQLEISDEGIWLSFRNASLNEVLKVLSDAGGIEFILDNNIQNDQVTGNIEGKDLVQAVYSYLYRYGYTVFPLPNKFLVRSNRSNQPFIHYEEGLFYLDITGGDLATTLREMASKANQPIVIYSVVRDTVSNMQLFGLSFEEGLQYILSGTTYSFREEEGVYFIGEGVTPRVDSPGFTESRLINLKYLEPGDIANMLPPSIPSQNIRAVPGKAAVIASGGSDLINYIENFIELVDKKSERDAILLPILYANSDEIVNVISRQFNASMYQYIQSQNAILLTGTAEMNERIISLVKTMDVPEMAIKTEVIPLQHISAEEAKSYLPTNIDSSRVLVANHQNSLIVTGRRDFIEGVATYLRTIDAPNPQIVFEVMIVELGRRASSQIGVSASTEDKSISFDLLSGTPFTLSIGSAFLADPKLTATISAMVQEGDAKLLANPSLTTLNGKEASFNVLTTSRYWIPQTNDSENNNITSSTFRTIETGIRLRLKPWVSASGDITIELHPEISDSAGSSSGSTLPSTNDRSVQTTVRVRDGETIVIGGLIQNTEHKEIERVPILGYIPILGHLFSKESISETETEFVITITSKLVDFVNTDFSRP